jgi:hypothetical protein
MVNIENNDNVFLPTPPNRCVIVIDQELQSGRAANAAAVIALTIGARHPVLVGEPLVDASGFRHPGLIPIGIPVLTGSQKELFDIRQKGLSAGCDVIDFPVEGQQTKNYQFFQEAVAAIEPEALNYVGVALVGQKKVISKIVGELTLLK